MPTKFHEEFYHIRSHLVSSYHNNIISIDPILNQQLQIEHVCIQYMDSHDEYLLSSLFVCLQYQFNLFKSTDLSFQSR